MWDGIAAQVDSLSRHANEKPWKAAISVLFGSYATLRLCGRLLDSAIERSLSTTYALPALLSEYQVAVADLEVVNWSSGPNLHRWAIGFFLNSAEQRIAAGIDKSVHAARALLEGLNLDDPRLDDNWAGQLMSIQLTELKGLLTEAGVRSNDVQQVQQLATGFESLIDTENAAAKLREFSESTGSVFDLTKNPTISNEDAVAIVCARVNAFKHRVIGLFDRQDFGHTHEFALTFKALHVVAHLCDRFIRSEELFRTRARNKKPST